jgi:hypothetical protein
MEQKSTYMVQVGLSLVPVDVDGVPTLVFLEGHVQGLVHVADEVRQEHQALGQVIWIGVNGDQSMLRTVLPVLTV